MQRLCFHKIFNNCQSHIIMTSLKVCKKVPPARSELGCWQFLCVMVEDSTLWPSGKARIWRSACPCKFFVCFFKIYILYRMFSSCFLLSLTSTDFPCNYNLHFSGQCESADHTLQDKPGSRCSGSSHPLVFSFSLLK